MKQFTTEARWRGAAPCLVAAIGAITTLVGFVGWAIWLSTGNWTPITWYFRYPAAFATITICFAEMVLCFEVWRSCEDREHMRPAWMWLFWASVAHLCGRLLAVPGSTSVAANQSASMNDVGRLLGGPLQMSLLLAGFIHLLLGWRRLGLLRRLAAIDYLLLAIAGGLAVRTMFGIWAFLGSGKPVTFVTAALWTSDPLLFSLLVAAILIRHSVARLGNGLLTNCWRSFAGAIVIVFVANATSWCLQCGYYEQWVSFSWYLWLPADAAFALAPAFQVAALQHVRNRAPIFETLGTAGFWRLP